VLAIVFWVSVGLIVYAHVGYALLLALLVAVRRRDHARLPLGEGAPSVSVIVAAYAEESVIAERVKNLRDLDYPRALELIVACDGSSDRTASRAREAGADLVLELPRGGKIRAQDAAVERASGEIVAFSDANASWERTALSRLVARFAEPRVGYVCGDVRFVDDGGTNQEGLYWRYEMTLRSLESRLRSVTGGNGAIYATRRDGPRPLGPVQHGQARVARRLRADCQGDREDGPHARGRVRPQAADDEPRLADRVPRRDALAAGL
jgi:cellulose synthase/poly-beta-1,6-N-acetylglucosamine synthase-like glycosyltransferase